MRNGADRALMGIFHRRLGRRAVLRQAALAGAGLASAFALACGGRASQPGAPSGPGAGAAATGEVGGKAAGSLIGRSGSPPANEQPKRGGVLNWYINGNPPTFDHHRSNSQLTFLPVSGVLSRLHRFRVAWDVAEANNRAVEPDLAQSMESPDAVTWVVRLRPDARFHDIAPVNGRAVEAEDVKATLTRALAPENPNRALFNMVDPAQIETPDRSTVIFKLNFPYAPFIKLLASGYYSWILPREAVAGEYDPSRKVIGSGPFMMESYTPDVGVTYKRNPNWFEQGRPYIDGVKLAIIPDAAQRLAQFTGGNLDYLSISFDDLETMQRQNPRAEVIKNWDPGDGQIFFQLGEPNSPFQDIRLRRALSLAIDREAYGRVMCNNQYIQGFWVSQTHGKWALRMEHLSPEVARWYTYNPQEARQLFEAAGGTNLEVRMMYPIPNPREPWLGTAGEMVFNMLKALPWKQFSFVRVDYTRDWIAGGKGKWYGNFPPNEILWYGIQNRDDVDLYLYSFFHSKSASNTFRLNDPKLDALIDRARAVLNEEERVQAYLEVQKYIAEQMYGVAGMPNALTYVLVQPRVRNYLVGDGAGLGTSQWSKLWLT